MVSKTQRRFSCLCTDVMSRDPCVYPIYQYTMPTSLVFQLESGPFLTEGIGSKKFADRGELETLAPTLKKKKKKPFDSIMGEKVVNIRGVGTSGFYKSLCLHTKMMLKSSKANREAYGMCYNKLKI